FKPPRVAARRRSRKNKRPSVSRGPFLFRSADQSFRLGRLVFVAPHRVAGVESLRAGLAIRLADLAIHVADVALELTDSLADGGADFRDSLRAENHQHDHEDDE